MTMVFFACEMNVLTALVGNGHRVTTCMARTLTPSRLSQAMAWRRGCTVVPKHSTEISGVLDPHSIGGGASVAASSSSVSYTHLRAHETRHDLVCRLLLEKK